MLKWGAGPLKTIRPAIVFEITGALIVWRAPLSGAQFSGVFVWTVHTFSALHNALVLLGALTGSWAHNIQDCAPEWCTK